MMAGIAAEHMFKMATVKHALVLMKPSKSMKIQVQILQVDKFPYISIMLMILIKLNGLA